MRSRILFLLALTLAFGGTARAASDADAVQAQVHGFYHWYVHALNANEHAEPMKSPEIHRYVTARFLHELDKKAKTSGTVDGGGLDYDPFIMAQDWDKAWERNIAIGQLRQQGAKWLLQVTLSGKEMDPQRLNLEVAQEAGTWKIDRVSDVDKH